MKNLRILELILKNPDFIFPSTMLDFSFRRKMLMTSWCLSCCWTMLYRAKDITSMRLLKLSCQQGDWVEGGGWKVAQVLGIGQRQDGWPTLAKGIFHTVQHYEKIFLKNCGEFTRGATAAQGLIEHQPAVGEQLHCTLLVL